MEDTLGELKIKDFVESLQSLNPYSNGRYSRRTSEISEVVSPLVLILILMEDTLGEQK